MKHAPRIHQIPFAKRCNIVVIKDVPPLDCPVPRLPRPTPHDIGRVDGVLVVIEAMNLASARLMRRQGMDAPTAADIKKIQAIQAVTSDERQNMPLGDIHALIGGTLLDKASPVLSKFVAFGSWR